MPEDKPVMRRGGNPNDNPEVHVTIYATHPVPKWLDVHNNSFAMELIRRENAGTPFITKLPAKGSNEVLWVDKRILDEYLSLYNKRYGESRGSWIMADFIAARGSE